MNIHAPFVYGQVSTPSESPQSSLNGIGGVGQASTTYLSVETVMSSVSAPFANPSASTSDIIMANLSNYQTDKTPLYSELFGTQVQAGIYK